MADGSINYNYGSIDDFHASMKQVVSSLESELADLQKSTHHVLDGHWSGAASQAYDENSNKIQKNLQGVSHWVDSLGSSVSQGGQNMHEGDRTNAKLFKS